MKQPINEIERLKLIAGLINEVDYNDAVYGVNRKTTLTEAKQEKTLHIDVANPFSYRRGLQYELEQMDDYSDEALDKAKVKVLKNLAKDANFYFNLLNQQPTGFEFKAPETDAPGMQANADGTLKKGAGKLEKANVKDSLSKSEAAKGKPKDVKELTDKGIEGKEKVVKEGVEEAKKLVSKEDKIAVIKEWIWYTCEEGTKTEDMDKYNKMIDTYFADKEDVTKEDFKKIWAKVTEKYGIGDVGADWEAFPETWKDVQTGTLVNESTGKEEMNEEFKYFDNYEEFENTLFQLYPQVKANPEKYKKERNGEVGYSDGYVNWGSWNPNRPNSPSGLPPGAVNMNNKLSYSDLIYPPGSRMDEDNMESNPANGDSSAEGQFNQLMSKYDWYHEMSDDPRKWDMGSTIDQKLKSLAKTIGVDKAVELFNDKAPSDRKVTTTFFAEGAEGKDKHAKIKETLKKGLKELISAADIQAAKLTGKPVNVSKANKQDITALQTAKANFTTYE
jgi:hypothetical protein